MTEEVGRHFCTDELGNIVVVVESRARMSGSPAARYFALESGEPVRLLSTDRFVVLETGENLTLGGKPRMGKS